MGQQGGKAITLAVGDALADMTNCNHSGHSGIVSGRAWPTNHSLQSCGDMPSHVQRRGLSQIQYDKALHALTCRLSKTTSSGSPRKDRLPGGLLCAVPASPWGGHEACRLPVVSQGVFSFTGRQPADKACVVVLSSNGHITKRPLQEIPMLASCGANNGEDAGPVTHLTCRSRAFMLITC